MTVKRAQIDQTPKDTARIMSPANVSLCKIIAHYFQNNHLQQHVFEPLQISPLAEVEIAFPNGHYDYVLHSYAIAVSQKLSSPEIKMSSESTTTVSDSPITFQAF